MSLSQSPLAPCPGTPNCEHERRAFPGVPPGELAEAAQDALGDLGPIDLAVRSEGETHRVDAVFRVALVFKDDVALAVTAPENAADRGSVLYIRSASRVGKGDLGVNQRRVSRFFRALAKKLG